MGLSRSRFFGSRLVFKLKQLMDGKKQNAGAVAAARWVL